MVNGNLAVAGWSMPWGRCHWPRPLVGPVGVGVNPDDETIAGLDRPVPGSRPASRLVWMVRVTEPPAGMLPSQFRVLAGVLVTWAEASSRA